jgi:ribosomal-protein-alanine N-acetyltransferase
MRPRGTTSTRVGVEDATEADVADLCAILEAAFPPAQRPTAPVDTEHSIREELARPWSHVWVARGPDDRALGFLVFWHVADEIHVLNVAVDPAYRRRGVGRELMSKAIEFGRSRRVRHLLLEVRRSNAAAIALYRSLGFYAMAVRRAYYSDGEDAVEMVGLFDREGKNLVEHEDEVRLDT